MIIQERDGRFYRYGRLAGIVFCIRRFCLQKIFGWRL